MPLPVAGGIFAWLIGLFGSAMGSFATWLMQRMIYEKAIQYTLITAGMTAMAGLAVTITLAIKAAIIAAQIAMPGSLGLATYFLPSNMAQIIGILMTARVSMAVYRWTCSVIAAYMPGAPGYKSLIH